MMNNAIFRRTAKENGVSLWEIALKLGISEATMTRSLRTPLPPEKEKLFLDTLNIIVRERMVSSDAEQNCS